METWSFELDSNGYAVVAFEQAGFRILNQDGILLCSNPTGADAFATTGLISAIQTRKIAEIKQYASEYILARFPIWKQMNMNMRGVELTEILHTREHTTEEATEATLLRGIATWIKEVRLYSGSLELAVSATSTWQEAASFDITYGWPE